MKKYADTILTVLITFLVTLSLNTILNYIVRDHGTVKTGTAIRVNAQDYAVLTVENFETKPANDLLFAIPASVVITEIISSHPIDIEELSATAGVEQIKYLNLSGVEPGGIVDILVPIESQSQVSLIRLINQEQVGFSTMQKEDVKQPFLRALVESLRIAIISSLIYGVVVFWVYSLLENSQNRAKEQTKELKEEIETKQEQNEELLRKYSDSADDLVNSTRRIRLLLFAKISDYEKELSFWRDTIRKMLYERKADKMTVDSLFDQVTKSLQTYSVQERGVDFDAVETLALMLKQRDESK
jgi:hypothetical protein